MRFVTLLALSLAACAGRSVPETVAIEAGTSVRHEIDQPRCSTEYRPGEDPLEVEMRYCSYIMGQCAVKNVQECAKRNPVECRNCRQKNKRNEVKSDSNLCETV